MRTSAVLILGGSDDDGGPRMIVMLNGESREVPDGASVCELVAAAGAPTKGVAVAVDGQVIPASRWGDAVPDRAVVEVLTAVQGG